MHTNAPPVRYVTTTGAVKIAYVTAGEGLPFVVMPPASSHVQLEWMPTSPLCLWLQDLSARFQLVRYDGHGQGMSSRDLTPDYSMLTLRTDLEAIVDQLELDRFVLMGTHASGYTAIRYAVDNPERVHALVLACCSASGSTWPLINAAQLARQNWEFFLSVHEATSPMPEQAAEFLRQSVTQRDWGIMAAAWTTSEVGDQLPLLRVPTLVLHPRNYVNIPSLESMKVASEIANAHIVLTEGAGPFGDSTSGIRAIEEFLHLPQEQERLERRLPAPTSRSVLSERQRHVLKFLAEGKTNGEIAAELVLSHRTVERHVSDIFTKVDVHNRAEAAVYWLRYFADR